MTPEAATAAIRKLATKVHWHSVELDKMAEEDMGHLTARLARKFHRAAKELADVDHVLQQVVAELDRAAP